MNANQNDIESAKSYFLKLSEHFFEIYSKLEFESPEWQLNRDKYVSLSNTVAQLCGEKSANPFI